MWREGQGVGNAVLKAYIESCGRTFTCTADIIKCHLLSSSDLIKDTGRAHHGRTPPAGMKLP